jgi:F-type H+-transporting ATPase subunit epsilon
MMPLPTQILLEVVTPEGLLLREEVDEVIAPGTDGYFGVRPGHTPFLSTLGLGALQYRQGPRWLTLTCFWGFCEVLPAAVNVLAELGERAQDIDVSRAEQAKQRAAERMRSLRDEEGFREAQAAYIRAVTRLTVARREPGAAREA